MEWNAENTFLDQIYQFSGYLHQQHHVFRDVLQWEMSSDIINVLWKIPSQKVYEKVMDPV